MLGHLMSIRSCCYPERLVRKRGVGSQLNFIVPMMNDGRPRDPASPHVGDWPVLNRCFHCNFHHFRMHGFAAVDYAAYRLPGDCPSIDLLSPHLLRCFLHHFHYETLRGMTLPIHQFQKRACWSFSRPSPRSSPCPARIRLRTENGRLR